MATQLEIWNTALSRIAADGDVQDPDETSLEARLCRLHWPMVRDSALRAHDWGFARRSAELSKLGDGEAGALFLYRYALPDDLIAVRGVNERWTYAWVPPALQPRFEIAGERIDEDEERLVLLSNDSPARLAYTARVETVSLYDQAFVEVAAWGLAAALAMPITRSEAKARLAADQAQGALYRAMALDVNQRGARPQAQPDWMTARGDVLDGDDWPYISLAGATTWLP